MRPTRVSLTDDEVQAARQVGDQRHANVVSMRLRDQWKGNDAGSRHRHRLGALSECAVASWLDVEWHPNTGADFREAEFDVAHCQVRATQHDRGGLIVHPTDPSDQPFVAVYLPRDRAPGASSYCAQLLGWAWGHEAKQRRWWREPQARRPCFIVPSRELRAMGELPDRLLRIIRPATAEQVEAQVAEAMRDRRQATR